MVLWRGSDVPFIPDLPFGSDESRGQACRSLLAAAGVAYTIDAYLDARGAGAGGAPPVEPLSLETVALWAKGAGAR